ncbi:MAG TPA: BTAD domain-containing putative transcriptional regulator [Gemmatimonadales bacterium]|nr:BTAD domain-containing putative transcriptional regulator [Gemmatimonadales bacterium]
MKLKTFGGLSIQDPDGSRAGIMVQRRRLAVLALLARAGERGMSRDKLVGYLWPESETEKARRVLAQAIYAMRRELGSDEAFLGTTEVRLNQAVISSDVTEFCSAIADGRREQAVALYNGPFLDGFFIDGAPEFERWVETERASLAQDYCEALERLAGEATSRSDYRAAVTWWRKLAVTDPLSGRVARGLMTALADAGDRAGALQHARIYENLVRQELDSAPEAEVSRLVEQLRATHPPVQAIPPAPPQIPPRAFEAAPEPQDPPLAVATGSPPTPARPIRRANRIAVSVLVIAALAFCTVLVGSRLWPRQPTTPDRKKLVVLPFKNLGEPQDQYFADGLAEEITMRLAAVPGLGIISRTSADQYRATTKTLKEIGRDLGVDYVLEGSVRWEKAQGGRGHSSRVRVTPQLIRVSDDSHLWADRYDATLADVFEVQARIAEQVTGALDIALGDKERAALALAPTRSTEAHDFYLRGNDYFNRSWGVEPNLRVAIEMFERATALDSEFALAYAKLSRAHAQMFWHYYDRSNARLAKAKAAADVALRLDPDLPEAHIALGFYHYWGFRDYDRALKEFGLAERGQANDADLESSIGAVARRQGKWDEAIKHLTRATELNPRSSSDAWEVAVAYFYLRDYAAAQRYLDQALALAPDWALAHAFKAQVFLSWNGDTLRARQAVEQAVAHADLGQLVGFLASARYLVTRNPRYFDALEGLRAKDLQDDTTYYYVWKAEWYHQRGDTLHQRVFADSGLRMIVPQLRARPDDDRIRLEAGVAYAMLGRKEDAIREARRAVELLPVSKDAYWGSDRLLDLASIYVETGESEPAIDLLQQLLRMPSAISVPQLKVDPFWDPLRAHPRFQQLIGEPSA